MRKQKIELAENMDGDTLVSGPRTAPGFVILLFVVFALVVSAMGVYFYVYERGEFLRAASDRLTAIAHWQLREIQTWRTERLRDATQFTTSPYNAVRVARFLNSSSQTDPGNDLLTYLNGVKETALYHDLMLADINGNVRVSTGGASSNLTTDEKSDLASSVGSGKTYLADIHRGDGAGNLHLNVYAPIWGRRAASSDSAMVGILILQLDPETFLYPLIEAWPTPTETGETVLARREGDEMVYLSRLRFRDVAPLTERVPMSHNETRAVVKAGSGVSGIVMAVDYRGAKVMGALNQIPDSPWYLVTKIDEEEITSPLKMVMALIIGITAGIILFLGAAMLLWWKRTEAKFLRVGYEAEKEKRYLLERVATERKRAEDQLRLYSEQLEMAVEDRTVRIRKLERERLEDEKQVALGRIAARVAHEINNPLTGIKNSFTLVKRAIPTDHRHYEFVDLIDRELDRIARIVRQMFELYRQERQTTSMACPADVIRDVTLLLSGNARSRQVTFDIETSESAQPVMLHEDSLRQALFSILQNGIEASPPGGCIQIVGATKNGNLVVTVADEGPGIPEQNQTRIFEPFFTTKEGLTTGGLGLGLSVTRGLVESLGGSVNFESLHGQGTTFTIVFPVTMPPVEKIHD